MTKALKIINVVGGIIIENSKILATQRGDGDYKGLWEFPGGKIEKGEAPETALIREIKEELNADITVDHYFVTVEHDYPTFHLSMKCYLCSLTKNDIVLHEHLSARWLGREDIESVDWLPADFPIVRLLIDRGIV